MSIATLAPLLLATLQATAAPDTRPGVANPVPMSAAHRAVAVDNCRRSILDNATRDYLAHNNLSAEQLPADFAARALPAVEPYLAVCDCLIDRLEADPALAGAHAGPDLLQAKIAALAADGGGCAPGGGTR